MESVLLVDGRRGREHQKIAINFNVFLDWCDPMRKLRHTTFRDEVGLVRPKSVVRVDERIALSIEGNEP